MRCALCKRVISDYDVRFNRLKIDDSIEVDICQSCIDRFLKWQQSVFTDLFPTKNAKRFRDASEMKR